jgi:capsular polysaccharide biosynthesis protein
MCTIATPVVVGRLSIYGLYATMRAGEVLRFGLRWSWLLVAGAATAAFVSYRITNELPRAYDAQTTLLVGSADLTSRTGDYGVPQTASQLALTYSRVLTTRPVLESAIAAGGFDLSYERAAGMVTATPVGGTQLIQISVRAPDPQLAATLSNLLAAAFMQQIETAQTGRYAAVENALARHVDDVNASQADLARQVERIQNQPPTPNRDAELARVQFELAQARQNYDATQRSYQDVLVTKARTTNPITVVDPAVPPPQPVQSQEKQNTLMAAAGGLLIAALAAYLVEQLDDRLLSGDRAERLTRLRHLGTVPSAHAEKEEAVNQGASSGTQLLAANIMLALGRPHPAAILITRTDFTHGATEIAIELAASIGQAGKRVILVDANLAQPTLQDVPGIDSRNGLSWLLTHAQIPAHDHLIGTGTPSFYVLPAGPSSRNAMDLLASERMELCVAELRELGDVVIFDGPLSLALARWVDGVVLVTDSRSRAGEVVAAATMLQGAGANLVGLVLYDRAKTSGLLTTGPLGTDSDTKLPADAAGELTRNQAY